MKILIVCQYYNPEPFRIGDICEALTQLGHQVTVVTGVPNYPEGDTYPGYEKAAGKETLERGVRVRRCWTIPRKRSVLRRIANYFSFAFSSTRYLSGLKEDYDVVYVHQLSPVMMGWGALRFAKKHGRKVVLYCLDLWPESLTAGGIRQGSAAYRLFYHISRKIYLAADRILVSSQGFAPYLRDFMKIPGEFGYLPQYAEDLFDTVPPTEVHAGPYHFVFAGNIGETQSVQTIIQAARLLREDDRVIFDIVGDGSALEHCRNLAGDLPNVVFHGRRDVSDMPEYYAMADAMLVSLKNNPSISATLPGKVQSYMAAGKAVVGSIGGETATVIREADCGACAAPEDSEDLARVIREMLNAPERFVRYGENARNYYQAHFQKDAFLRKLIRELQEHAV